MEKKLPDNQQDKIYLWLLVFMSFTGVSLGTIGKAMLTPFHLLMSGMILVFLVSRQKYEYRIPLSLCLLATWIIIVNLLNYHSLRMTSFIYSMVYFIEFFVLFNLNLFVKHSTVKKAFVFILYAYGINLLIGATLLSFHLELPVIKEFIRSYTIVETGEARPMGFSTEPSYAGFILGVSYLCYNHLNEHNWNKEAKRLSIIYLVAVLLLKSAYGFLFLGLNLVDNWIWMYKKGSSAMRKLMLLSSIFLLVGSGFVFQKAGNESIQRIQTITQILTSAQWTVEKKMKKFQEADSSGFARIGPSYLLYVKRSTYSLNMWMGGGAGKAGIFLPKFLEGILVDEGVSIDAGIIPSFIIDYGLIGLGLLVLFLVTCFYNLSPIFWITFALIFPNANLNTQLFWYGTIAFLLVSNFKNNHSISS